MKFAQRIYYGTTFLSQKSTQIQYWRHYGLNIQYFVNAFPEHKLNPASLTCRFTHT